MPSCTDRNRFFCWSHNVSAVSQQFLWDGFCGADKFGDYENFILIKERLLLSLSSILRLISGEEWKAWKLISCALP